MRISNKYRMARALTVENRGRRHLFLYYRAAPVFWGIIQDTKASFLFYIHRYDLSTFSHLGNRCLKPHNSCFRIYTQPLVLKSKNRGFRAREGAQIGAVGLAEE
jgi:hypothetical protein